MKVQIKVLFYFPKESANFSKIIWRYIIIICCSIYGGKGHPGFRDIFFICSRNQGIEVISSRNPEKRTFPRFSDFLPKIREACYSLWHFNYILLDLYLRDWQKYFSLMCGNEEKFERESGFCTPPCPSPKIVCSVLGLLASFYSFIQ